MSDKSIVHGGNLIGGGCSALEQSALDQSLFYPSDMSALPTSTPNPANFRRKSRRSWFETTPKGFKFEIAVEKPAVKAPVRKSDTVEVLTLTHFSAAPRLGFGTLKVGHEKTCTLLLRNPHDYEQSVKIEKFPEKKHFSVSCKEFIVGPEESYPLDITWSPKEAGGCREMILMQVDQAYRVQAYVFGTVTAPPPQKKKTKRVGLLASKATRPLSVIHTKSLANINHEYSPEKKIGKQITKVAVQQKLSKQVTLKSVKPWAQPKSQVLKSKPQKVSDGISKKDRWSGEPKRKSPRLSDKYKEVNRYSVENIENTDPDSVRRKERRSSGRKASLPKPKIEEKLSRKKMRRSNTYSQVSGLGLVVPIIHGDTVKGLQDTSLLNIDDCNISGVKMLEDSDRKIENNCLEPSFLEPGNELYTQTLKESVVNVLEPSFLSHSKDNDIENTVFIKEEAKTLLKCRVADNLEPSFLEKYNTVVAKSSALNNVVKNSETFHDSLDVENQSIEEPSFLQNENVKPERTRRSLRKRSGIVEVESDDKPTGVKLLRGAKRNNARKVSPEEYAREMGYKGDGWYEKLADKHKPLDESVGQSSLLEQLKSLKSYVHDKSLEIEKSGNESFIGTEDKCSAEDMQRRETFVKCRTSPRFSMPVADENIRRGTFVTESTKLKLLETQKPSEASPRRTTFTVTKESSNSRKLLKGKGKGESYALNEEEETDIEIEVGKNQNTQEEEDKIVEIDHEKKQLERLYSADSLENDSFEKQAHSPEKIFVEGKVEWARRATLTVTKSRPSDALLEHAKKSAAAIKKFGDESALKHAEQADSNDLVDARALTEVHEEISPQTSSQNSTFEVPIENSVLVGKDSSFPTTPYHLLPMSPQLNHSRRSTHIVEKPKVVNLRSVDGKKLFANEVDENVADHDNHIEIRDRDETEHSPNNKNNNKAVQGSQIEEENIDNLGGPSSNLRRRKLSARRAVENLGRKSTDSLNTSLIINEVNSERRSMNGTESVNKHTKGEKKPEAQEQEPVDQLFFVPFNNKEQSGQPKKPLTRRPDPKQFLKKRSNPVTQEEDRLSSKRPKSESAATILSRKNSLDDDNRSQGKQTTKAKETVAAPARVTRQRVKSVGAAKSTNSCQGTKPASMVKGLATSKLILTKKSKTAIPKHPLPFAAKNMFYDERWMEKQERGFVNWLNFILTPPEEHQGSDVKVKVDAGKLTLDIEKGRTRLAPTNEILSFRTYSAHRKLNRLRKLACRLFQSESVRRVIQKVEQEVENKRLLVRKDKMLHADVGAKQKVLDMLLSYNPLWLRVGLETIYGEVVPIQCNTDVYGLSQFIVLRVLGSPDIAEEFAHPTVPHLYKDGYAEATAQHTLKRFLMLVYFLDQAKQHMLIDHNPCLFCKNSDIKTSKDMLLLFSRDFLSGEGDITRHLGYLGYKVTYSQTALDEFDFAVKSLGTDLRDGLRLARVIEVICDKAEQIRKSLRTPAISRLQKIHNLEVVFKVLEQQNIDTGVVTTRDIVDGHREKTLSLLWTIILHYQVAMVINIEQVKEEIQILERSYQLKKELHKFVTLQTDIPSKRRESEGPDLHTQDERLNLLMKWCRAVCAFYDIKVENFTVSFSDGRALCHILHYYHPRLLPLSEIQNETSMTHLEDMEKNCRSNMNCSLNDSVNSSAVFGDTVDPAVYERLLANEKENFKKLSEKVKELGGIPLMLRWSDMSNTIPDEKVVVTYLMYLCARLLDIRHESRAARVIQHAWRAHRLRKIQALYEVKSKAIVVIQHAVRKFLHSRREKNRQSAALCIQRVWRGHLARSQVQRLRREIMLQKEAHAVNIVQNAVKRYLHRRRYLMMKVGVVHVQAYCRGYLYRRTRQVATTNIQRVFRGYLARKQVSKMQSAVVKIQSCIRSFLVRKMLCKQILAASIIQSRYRACLAMRKQHYVYDNMKKACIIIQKWWRRNLTLRYEREERASITIQACFRCWVARKHYQKLRENTVYLQSVLRGRIQRREFENCKCAVLLIQRRFRTYLETRTQRQTFLQLKQTVTLLQSQRRMLVQRRKYLLKVASAKRLQAYVRMLIQRRKFHRLKSSVITLQKFYRAYLLGNTCRRDYLITVGATITLQAGVRGMICRRQFQKTKQLVIMTQAVVRGHIQCKKYQKIKQAAVFVQRRYRQTMVARLQRSNFLKMRQAVVLLQSKWRMSRERKNYTNLKSSVVLIQSSVRKMIQQNKFKKMKSAVKTIEKYYHAKVKGDICRRQFLVNKGAAMTLQAIFRGYQVRKAMKARKVSAIKIQSSFRGFIQRKQYIKLKKTAIFTQRRLRETLVARQQRSNFIQMKQAAIVIQSTWRMNKEKNSYLKMKKSIVLIQSFARKMNEQNKFKKMKTAVKTIENYYHAKLIGDICRRQFLVSKGAAMTLQGAFRGHQVRKAMKERHISATKIQKAFRGHVQRKQFQKLKHSAVIFQRRFREMLVAKQQRSDFIRMKQAAISLQSAWRMNRERFSYLRMKRSVILVQAAVRKMIHQNKYNRLKSAVKTVEKYYHAKVEGDIFRRKYLVCKGAAMTLQAAFRGYKVRKAMKERNASAVKIQAIYRGFAQHKQFQELKKTTLFCQRKYRLRQLGRKVQGQYFEARNSAITIQAAYKGYIQRKQYREMCKNVVKIQSVVRGYLQQQKYKKIHSAIVVIQKRIKETQMSQQQRKSFLRLKHTAIIVQSLVRMKQEQSRFASSKAAAILIQSRVRAYIQERKYKKMIAAANIIQKYFRSRTEALLYRQQFLITKGAAITIQAFFRGHQVRLEKKIELKSAIVIQSAFRAYCQQKQYLQLKNAANVFKKYYRAILMRRKIQQEYRCSRKAIIQIQTAVKTWSCRRKFMIMKNSVIKIQAVYRKHASRQRYQKQRQAAVTIQTWLRGLMLTSAARRNFLLQRGAAITIQAYAKMYMMRKLYLEVLTTRKNSAAVRIQTSFRRHIAVQRFQCVKNSVILCQRKYRAKCCGKHERQSYVELKKSAIKIQSSFRAMRCQQKYSQMKSASVTIQSAVRVWRAKKLIQNLKYEKCRHNAAVTLQSGFRALKARRQLTALREENLQQRQEYLTHVSTFMRANMAAIVIQRCYRNYKIMKVAKERLHSILLIQRWMRSKLQRIHYLKERAFIICIQSHVRTWLAKRDRAARVIQRAARHWLGDAATRKQNRAAIKIQALWRGYHKRKTIKSRRLTLLRKRVQETAASVTEEKKLGNRTSSALDFLLRYKLLSQVMDALQHLEVASRLSWICCERMVEAIPVLYRLVESCNRSLPHMDIIKCTISILTNLAKYEKTRGAVSKAERGVDILVNLMQIYREKPPVFNKICTLLGILALDTPCKTSILADKKLVEKLTSIQSLTARKHKLEENQRVTRARMNASSLNSTFLISAPVKKHKIKPDWALHKDKMNDIENPLKAINFVLGNLGIKPNTR